LTGAWATFADESEAAWVAFLAGPFSEESTETVLELWAEQINEATLEAASTHQDALSVEKWKAALSELKSSLDFVRSKGLSS
jgi:hypothetical protein